MKKWLAIILVCVMVTTTAVCAFAVEEMPDGESSLKIVINGENTEAMTIYMNDSHYVPLRLALEKMGTEVFYRSSDWQILALSQNGDMIRHFVGSNVISVNDTPVTFVNSSILKNGSTYIPLEMVLYAFYPEELKVEGHQLIINKDFTENSYHKIIKDVLNVCRSENFNPEKYQEYISYHSQMPWYSVEDAIFRVNIGLIGGFYENIKTIEYPHEPLVLVNKYNQLPSNFSQDNLVLMNSKYTNGGQHYLLDVAYEKYAQMADAAKNAGLSMRVVSSYRTEDYQRYLYNNKLKTTGRVNADNYSARPGHSEHQTGLAVDINSTSVSFEYTSAFKWLQSHAHEYGFIMRYPRGKEWITGYAYEPWHYRYVGVEAATKIVEKGLTYEEYYAYYVKGSEFK